MRHFIRQKVALAKNSMATRSGAWNNSNASRGRSRAGAGPSPKSGFWACVFMMADAFGHHEERY
jgi:hypothetical protein